jgi:hypothetical protein
LNKELVSSILSQNRNNKHNSEILVDWREM